MSEPIYRSPSRVAAMTRRILGGAQGLAILSATMLAGYWAGGPAAMVGTGFAIPLLFALLSTSGLPGLPGSSRNHDGLTGLPLRRLLISQFDALLRDSATRGAATACFVLELDDFQDLVRRFDHRLQDRVVANIAARLRSAMRDSDVVAWLGRGRFGVVPATLRSGDLEGAIQIATRLQAAVAEPISASGTRVYVTASTGFVLGRQLPGADGAALLDAAEGALADARRQGNGAIRAFAPGMAMPDIAGTKLVHDVGPALDSGAIHAWFQPQVSTDTGEVTGFEALARWAHPKHGMIAPADFLPAIAAAA